MEKDTWGLPRAATRGPLVSARPTRRTIERARLDEMAATAYSWQVAAETDSEGSADRADAVADFLAGVAFERRRTRLVWRRQAPDWLKIGAAGFIAVLGFAAVYLMLLALSLAPI